jgi:hypothetical protein
LFMIDKEELGKDSKSGTPRFGDIDQFKRF